MNKTKMILITAASLLAVTGCGVNNTNVSPTPAPAQTTQSTQSTAPTAPTAQNPTTAAATGSSTNSAAPINDVVMDEKEIVKLAADGVKRYWHVQTGGGDVGSANGATDGGPMKTFAINGMDHRYLGSDIDTKEKLLKYLQESFTLEASEAFIKAANIVEHQGRLAQPNADGGSLLDWPKAQASLVKEDTDTKQYELKVPVGETTEFQVVRVDVKKVEGQGWKLATPAFKLR